MRTAPIRVLVESTPKRVFISALDWPGWSRGARTEEAAVEALLAAATRYARVATAAGVPFGDDGRAAGLAIEVVERVDGDAGTAFGVPSVVCAADREPVDAPEAERHASLVAASWAELDRVAANAPEELRKGPRGGGRDRTKMVRHVVDAEAAYASVLGRKHTPSDATAITDMRADLLEVLRQPSDGSPIAGRRWPPRYAARRIAWHVLDHAWEIEDRSDARSEPGTAPG